MRVTSLRVYPVKSLAGLDVERAAVEPWGLARDRRWCLLDAAGSSEITVRKTWPSGIKVFVLRTNGHFVNIGG